MPSVYRKPFVDLIELSFAQYLPPLHAIGSDIHIGRQTLRRLLNSDDDLRISRRLREDKPQHLRQVHCVLALLIGGVDHNRKCRGGSIFNAGLQKRIVICQKSTRPLAATRGLDTVYRLRAILLERNI